LQEEIEMSRRDGRLIDTNKFRGGRTTLRLADGGLELWFEDSGTGAGANPYDLRSTFGFLVFAYENRREAWSRERDMWFESGEIDIIVRPSVLQEMSPQLKQLPAHYLRFIQRFTLSNGHPLTAKQKGRAKVLFNQSQECSGLSKRLKPPTDSSVCLDVLVVQAVADSAEDVLESSRQEATDILRAIAAACDVVDIWALSVIERSRGRDMLRLKTRYVHESGQVAKASGLAISGGQVLTSA